MVSKEAQAVIEMLFEGKRRRKAMPKPTDPRLALIDSIYAERHMTDEHGRNTPLPEMLTRTDDYADGVLGEWLRYTGEDRQDGKVILFVHGGAFNTGSAVSRRNLTARLALACRIDTFSINYRLCPEYKYPAHLDDCVTAYLWLVTYSHHLRCRLEVGASRSRTPTCSDNPSLSDSLCPRVPLFR